MKINFKKIMEIYEANALKVKNIERNKEYIAESQEHCDVLWYGDEAVVGDYTFYKYPDLSEIEFTSWQTKEKLYLNVLEYSFNYGETWSKIE